MVYQFRLGKRASEDVLLLSLSWLVGPVLSCPGESGRRQPGAPSRVTPSQDTVRPASRRQTLLCPGSQALLGLSCKPSVGKSEKIAGQLAWSQVVWGRCERVVGATTVTAWAGSSASLTCHLGLVPGVPCHRCTACSHSCTLLSAGSPAALQ